MSKEIRSYEFKVNNAQVFFNEKGEIKYKGKGDGKNALKKLQPLFDAIAKSDTSYKSNDKKVDSRKEKDLMHKLHTLLMADGIVDKNELKLGDEFTKSGLSAEDFINKKLSEANRSGNKTNPANNDNEEEVDTVVRQKTFVDYAREDESVDDETKEETVNTVVTTENVPEPKKEEPAPKRPDPRVSARAYNQSIQNQKTRRAGEKDGLTSSFTSEVSIKSGDTLYQIAIDALKAEGKTKPTAKQINDRIVEIAIVNNLNDVNNIKLGTTLKVGRGTAPASDDVETTGNSSTPVAVAPTDESGAPAGGASSSSTVTSTPVAVAPSTITIADKTANETLEELKYQAVEKTVEAADGQEPFDYKEWTKEGSATMYTTEVNGVVLAATSLEDLTKLRADYNKAIGDIKTAPEGEADDAKAARQAQNLESIKKLIELSGGDINAVKKAIEYLRTDGYVDIQSEEVQAFVQELIKTKNVQVLDALLMVGDEDNGNEFSNQLLGNNKTSAETLASLYQEIRAKENRGEKLTDEEVELKKFLKNKAAGKSLYTIEADTDQGIVAKEMNIDDTSGALYYSANIDGLDIWASDPNILDEFAKDYAAANTDEKKNALFRKYAATNDKAFAQCLASHADELKAAKEDVLEFVNKNDMYVLQYLFYPEVDTISNDDLKGYGNGTTETIQDGENTFEYTKFTKNVDGKTETIYVKTVGDMIIKADSPDALKTAVQEYCDFNSKVTARVVSLYTEAKGDPANMYYLNDAFRFINRSGKSEDEITALKDQILESFFEVTETTAEDGTKTKSYKFNPSRRPTYEEISGLLEYADKEMAKAVLDYIPSIDDLGKGQYTQFLETRTSFTTADLKAKYAELFDKAAAEFDLENDLDGAKAKVLQFIDAVGPNIDLIPFDKIQEKFPDVEFVKEHLGPQRDDDNILRKLTVLDLDIKESEPDSDGKVTYSVEFSMATELDYANVAQVKLKADTKEELLQKAEAYIELQNISYETHDQFDYDNYQWVINENHTDNERNVNLERLNEMFNDENMDRDVKLAIVNFVIGQRGVYDEALIDSIIETKDPDFIKMVSIGWNGSHLTDAQAKNLIEYAKNPKLADGKNNPFYLGTASGNDIRTAIVNRKKKNEIEAIYDSLRPSDRLQVIKNGSVDNPAEKFEQLVKDIIDTNENSIRFYDILTLALDKGYALSNDTANKLMAKIQRPLPVHSGRNPIYSWANDNGDTFFYQLENTNDGKIKFVRTSTKDYAAEIKYEIDNNGAGHKIEKRQAEALSRLSSSAVAAVILEYSANGKGLIKSWNDEYAWFGDALGVDDMMPVIKKVLEYGDSRHKSSEEYKTLQELVEPYLSQEGNANTTNDFPSDTATAIDNAMIAYIKKVKNT